MQKKTRYKLRSGLKSQGGILTKRGDNRRFLLPTAAH